MFGGASIWRLSNNAHRQKKKKKKKKQRDQAFRTRSNWSADPTGGVCRTASSFPSRNRHIFFMSNREISLMNFPYACHMVLEQWLPAHISHCTANFFASGLLLWERDINKLTSVYESPNVTRFLISIASVQVTCRARSSAEENGDMEDLWEREV